MSQSKKKNKVTRGHKATLGALSVLGMVAGWNLVGRAEQQDESAAAPLPTVIATPPATGATTAAATPWPTIAPVAERPRLDVAPLPTLVAIALPDMAAGNAMDGMAAASVAVPGLMAMPTLAPLPAMPEYVAPPPPPPPPVEQVAAAPPPANTGGGNNGGGNNSGGS